MTFQPSRFRRALVGLCLLVYLQAAGLFPALLALAATLERSHSVGYVQTTEDIRLVLHHSNTITHRHGSATRLVCEIAAASSNFQADHVASFTCNATSEKANAKPKMSITANVIAESHFNVLFCQPRSKTEILARCVASCTGAACGRDWVSVLLI
jgi:hypothetical protein